jgi:hypothetical protein
MVVFPDHAVVSQTDEYGSGGSLNEMLVEAQRLVFVVLSGGWESCGDFAQEERWVDGLLHMLLLADYD